MEVWLAGTAVYQRSWWPKDARVNRAASERSTAAWPRVGEGEEVMSGTPLTMLDMLRAQIERHIEHLKRLDVELAAMEAHSNSPEDLLSAWSTCSVTN